ncbi:MAG: caspase family protein [Vulcanimicrobiota bacterium]
MSEVDLKAKVDGTRDVGHKKKVEQALEFAQEFDKRAFILGINSYGDEIPELQTPVADATAIGDCLARMGYSVERCIQNESVRGVAEDVRGWLGKIREAAQAKKTRMVVYYAGHGKAEELSDKGSLGSLEGYLIPAGASLASDSWIPMSALYEAVCGGPGGAGPQHLLLILDCCFAGAIRWAEGRRSSSMRRLKLSPEQFEYFLAKKAALALTSASFDQEALDIDPKRRRGESDEEHSPFANALLDLLEGRSKEAAPLREDGIVTATEMIYFLQQRFWAQFQDSKRAGKHLQTPGLYPLTHHAAGDYCFELPDQPADFAVACTLTTEMNPWKGLTPFRYNLDKGVPFYGREAEAARLRKLVSNQRVLKRKEVRESRLVIVTGPSGCGKSSLVNAALLPYLRDQKDWKVLEPASPRDLTLDEIRNIKNECPEGQGCVWFLDQLEEVFTSPDLAGEGAKTYREALRTLLGQPPANLRIVATVREDYEIDVRDLLEARDFWPETEDEGRFVPSPLNRDELCEIVVRPAQERTIFFEPPKIVDWLVDQIGSAPGALPLLSHALSELYLRLLRKRDEQRDTSLRSITQKDYEDMDGVRGSLRSSANEIYREELKTDLERDMMINVLIRMITMMGGEPTRRRVYKTELEFAPKEVQDACDKVVRVLGEHRLIVSSADPGGNPYLQPAHEELLRSWPPLREWTQSERGLKDLLLLRKVTEAAQQWHLESTKTKATRLWEKEPELDLALIRFGFKK